MVCCARAGVVATASTARLSPAIIRIFIRKSPSPVFVFPVLTLTKSRDRRKIILGQVVALLPAARPCHSSDDRTGGQAGAGTVFHVQPSEPPEPAGPGRHRRRLLGDLRKPPRLSVAADDRRDRGAGRTGPGPV